MDKTRKQLLTRAEKDPRLALENGWYQDPELCAGFFDRCEDRALLATPSASDLAAVLDLALKAGEMAATNGDPCLKNRAAGVLVHAHVARGDLFWAGKVLYESRDAALACCPRCRGEHFRREGDLQGELRKPREALEALARCLAEAGHTFTDDARGRFRFVRAIAYHHDGQRDRALDDAGRALAELSLSSPRGFFLDTVACMAIYAGGGDARHDEVALEHLRRLDERIRGGRWTELRTRMSWARGHHHARLDEARPARESLESAFRKLLFDGHEREIAAAAVDVATFRCRSAEPRQRDVDAALEAIGRCLAKRADLTEDRRRGLGEMVRVLQRRPEAAFAELRAFRRSFTAPVPGRLGERVEPRLAS
jgi:tetratricopeptide (TPR) repeat protein